MDFLSHWRIIMLTRDDSEFIAVEVKILEYFILAAFGVDG